MQEDRLKIGAVTANYNGGKFFKDCLGGLLSQTIPVDYYCVIDDGSTDDSQKLIFNQLSKLDKHNLPQYIFGQNQTNKGPSASRNEGIKKLINEKCDIIFIADIDDIYYPTKVEESIKIFEKYSEVALVYSDYDTESTNGHLKREFKEIYSFKRLSQECIVSSNAAIKSKIFNIVGLYDESIRYGEDYDLWLRISEVAGIYHIPKALYKYRMTGENVTTTIAPEKFAKDVAKVKEKAAQRRGINV